MILKSIELRNYRQYRDAKINFADPSEGRPFTVIDGANGTGKTNILNAITWCLYGEESHLISKNKGLPSLNTQTLAELSNHKAVNIEVVLRMEDGNGKQEIFRRRATAIKEGDAKIRLEPSELDVRYQNNRDWVKSEDPIFRVERVLPRDIQEYFIFDGERLDKYFARGPKQGVAHEVYKISQLSLFQTVIDHLEKKNTEYTRELKDISPDVDRALIRWNHLKDELEKTKGELDKLKSSLARANQLEEQLLTDLKGLPIRGNELRTYQDRRQRCESRLITLEKEITEAKHAQFNALFDYSKIILSYRAMSTMKELLSQKVQKGDIPPDYKRKFIERLLETGRCICGTDIHSGTCREEVEQLLQKSDNLDEIAKELIIDNHQVSRLLEKVKSFNGVRDKHARILRQKEDEYSDVSNQLKETETLIGGIDDNRVKDVEAQYRIARHEKDQLVHDVAIKGEAVKRLTIDAQIWQDNYEKELKKIAKHDKTKAQIEFCLKSISVANRIIEEIKEELRKEIEEKTKQQFLATVWKKGSYRDVTISSEYDISVLDQNGLECIGTLSAGERQLLALAFIDALHVVSGFVTPIIIDTPLARISGEPRLNLARSLPSYTANKQIILLMTDQEYTREVRDALTPYVGAEYSIRFYETDKGNRSEVMRHE